MESSLILLINLKKKYDVDSIRLLADRMGFSKNILLNWSSGRSSPSIKQLDDIAYSLGVEVSELLIENNSFTIETKVWRDNVEATLVRNLGRLRLEKGIQQGYFNASCSDQLEISYRSFLRYVNGQNKHVNLAVLDTLAKIFNIETYKLLEKEQVL